MVVEGGVGIEKNLFVGGGAEVTGILTVTDDADFNGSIDVDGHTELDDLRVAGVSTFVGIGTFESDLFVAGNLNVIGDIVYDEVTGRNIDITGIATIGTILDVNGDLDVDGHTELDNVNVSGIITSNSLSVLTNFDVYDTQAVFHNDLFIAGNLSIGGTTTVLIAEDLFIIDKTIVLGITTDSLNVDIANDDSANGGGISIASTEGNPLVSLQAVGVNSLPNTHKKILWSKANTYGIGTTDAWMFNYAVGIGSTLVPNGVRFAVKEIQFTDDTINTPNINVAQNLNVSATSTLGIASVSQLYVSGVSTFSGLIDANGDLDVDGHTELDNLNVAGFSTFVGFATFQDYVFIQDGLNVAGVVTATTFVGDGSSLTGTASGLTAAVGVSSEGTFVGTGATIINFASSNGAAMNVTVSGGIATATVTPGVSIGLAIALGG